MTNPLANPLPPNWRELQHQEWAKGEQARHDRIIADYLRELNDLLAIERDAMKIIVDEYKARGKRETPNG